MQNAYVLVHPDGEWTEIIDPVRIGRDRDCEIALADPLVSRHHATLWLQGSMLMIQDEGSINGVYVNAKRIGAALALNVGDSIQIGERVFTVSTIEDLPARAIQYEEATAPLQTKFPLILLVILALLLVCICVVAGVAGYFFFLRPV